MKINRSTMYLSSMENVLVLDNGGYNIKVGLAGGECSSVFNGLARSRDRQVFVANEIANCRDFTSLQLRRPIERGHLASWELQKSIWDWIFDSGTLPTSFDVANSGIIYTESPYSLPALSTHTDQIIFEEYGFSHYRRCTAASLIPWNDTDSLFGQKSVSSLSDACLVVDSGFNATNIVPVVHGNAKYNSIRRVDVAGKVLTNFLKETISFRYYNMMDETYLINSIKEQLCYVSRDFGDELNKWRTNKHAVQKGYLLPDHKNSNFGRVLNEPEEIRRLQKEGEHQLLVLANERFSIPEALFDPREVDFDQAGIAEAVAQSISSASPAVQPLLWSNIILVGGTANLRNFSARLESDLRFLAPQGTTVRVATPSNPIEYAWNGGSVLGTHATRNRWFLSRDEYLESGESACLRKFGKNPGMALESMVPNSMQV